MTVDSDSKGIPYLLVVKDSRTPEKISVESITSQFGLHQIINAPTHILKNSSWFVDLTFALKTKLSVESELKPHFPPSCDHHITYAKCSFEFI